MRLSAAPFALLLAACGAGKPADAPEAARPTIVSLNPCADAILAEVAAPGQLLAISHYSHDSRSSSMLPEDAARFASTGGTVEEVLALGPDVVVADSFLPPATRAAFDALGIRVETMSFAADLSGARAQVRQLAGIAGDRASGEALVADIDRAWSDAATDGPRVPALMWQQGGIVPGPESLVAAMMEQSGFALHSATRGLGQGAYLPLEQVLADPPRVILAAGDEPMLTHPVLRDLSGTSYASFDPSLVFCAGPTIPRALARLAEVRQSL